MKNINKHKNKATPLVIYVLIFCGITILISLPMMLLVKSFSDLAMLIFCLSGFMLSIIGLRAPSSKIDGIKREKEIIYYEVIGLLFGVLVCTGAFLKVSNGKYIVLGISIVLLCVLFSLFITKPVQ
jgi:hypothetical protein